MEKINKIIEDIDNNNYSIEKKLSLTKKLNKLITKEKANLNNMYENLQNNQLNVRNTKKYENKSIDELNSLFIQSDDINEKIKIYSILSSKVNDELDEIFTNEDSLSE
jgi:hypothetical protein